MNAYIDLSNPIFRYEYKGFCSIINQVIDIALEHYLDYNNYNLIIKDSQIEYLFDILTDATKIEYNSSNYWLDKFLNGNLKNKQSAHNECNVDNLFLRNNFFNKVLSIKPYYKNKFSRLKEQLIDDDTLGIQIRGTDKVTELPAPNLEKIFSLLDKQLDKKESSIFLSTDDFKYIDLLQKRYGNILKYNSNNTISRDGLPLHFRFDRNKLNEEVLSDVFLLSSCKKFFYCYSNVSYLALTLGINNFNHMELIN